MNIRSSSKKDQGFTILEALIAFVVFSLGSLAIITFLARSLELNADGETRTEALHLANEKIEEYRAFVTKAEVQAYTSGADGSTITGNSAIFTRSWTVSNAVGNSNAILLTVTVSWTDRDGVTQTVSLASSIAKVEPKRAGKYLMTVNFI